MILTESPDTQINNELWELISARDRLILQLVAERNKLQVGCIQKESVIQELTEALRQRDVKIKSLSSPWWKKLRRSILKIIFKTPYPLGVLYQYKPKPLVFRPLRPKKTTKPLPGFCILTPSYNQGAFLERTLLSVLNQNYPKLRYGVQDGGSTDESPSIIQKYSAQLAYSDSRPDKGQAAAINYGFSQMEPRSDEIMAWLNSDDVLLPGALHNVAAYFAENSNVDVIYGHRIIIDENDHEVGRWYLPPHLNEVLLLVDYVPQETMFWRSSAYKKLGGLDISFKFAMDWDLIVRFQEVGCKIVRLPLFIGCFRHHKNQKTVTEISELGNSEMAKIRNRLNPEPPSHSKITSAIHVEQRRSALTYRLCSLGLSK